MPTTNSFVGWIGLVTLLPQLALAEVPSCHEMRGAAAAEAGSMCISSAGNLFERVKTRTGLPAWKSPVTGAKFAKPKSRVWFVLDGTYTNEDVFETDQDHRVHRVTRSQAAVACESAGGALPDRPEYATLKVALGTANRSDDLIEGNPLSISAKEDFEGLFDLQGKADDGIWTAGRDDGHAQAFYPTSDADNFIALYENAPRPVLCIEADPKPKAKPRKPSTKKPTPAEDDWKP